MKSQPNTTATAKTSVATGSAADAVVTLAADTTEAYVIDWIAASYQGTAITGNLLVQIGGTTYLNMAIDGATYEWIFLPFHVPMSSSQRNEAVVVTLADGGTGVAGKLTVGYR